MPYNRNLYSSSDSAIDAGMVYDQTEEKLQSEINAEVSSDITELDASLSTFTHSNLLYNWYFVGGGSQLGDGIFPINQNALTSYNINNSYSIDGWYGNNANVVVGANYITVKLGNGNSSLRQRFRQKLIGKIKKDVTYTFSSLCVINTNTSNALQIWLSDNVNGGSMALRSTESYSVSSDKQLIVWTFTPTADLEEANIEYITSSTNANLLVDISIFAAKLELGDAQTLAHQENGEWVLNEIPIWEEEYLKCNNYNDRKNPRPNLLDNWYFVGGGSQLGGDAFPINQSGRTSYISGTTCFDRWLKSGSMSVTLTSEGITIAASAQSHSVYQAISGGNNLAGKTVTLSILMNEQLCQRTIAIPETLPTSTQTIGQGTPDVNGYSAYIRTVGSVLSVVIYANSNYSGNITIQAIKVELGDTQTLAHQENGEWVLNDIPNWEEEYLKCNKYRDVRNPRPNLLDNWYFVGGGSQLGEGIFPINSQGSTSYTTAGVAIDHWSLVRGSVTIQQAGLLCTSPNDNTFRIEHKFPYGVIKNLLGKTCTFSALVDDTFCEFITVVSEAALQKSFNVNGNTFNLNINFDTNWGNVSRPLQFFVGTAQSVTVKAVKFEIGDTQTLAHQENGAWVLNEVPNWQEMYLKCGHSFMHNLSQIGLSGTKTLKQIHDAMPYGSSIVLNNANVDQTDMTLPAGTGNPASVVVLFKSQKPYDLRTFAIGVRSYSGIDNARSQLYFASYNGTSFVGWKKLVSEDEYCYAANDTMYIGSSVALHGVIGNTAATAAYFEVVTEKSMKNISSITVTAMSGYISGPTGAVNSTTGPTNYTASPYTITCTKQGTNHVRIGVTKSSAFTNVVAYAAITYFGTLTLKFT